MRISATLKESSLSMSRTEYATMAIATRPKSLGASRRTNIKVLNNPIVRKARRRSTMIAAPLATRRAMESSPSARINFAGHLAHSLIYRHKWRYLWRLP